MPLPYIFRKLFTNSGAGDKLNTSLIPDTVVQTTTQSFTTAEQTQARNNLGVSQANLGGPFLPLSGGTMTGNIIYNVSGADSSAPIQVFTESGNNYPIICTTKSTAQHIALGIGSGNHNRGLFISRSLSDGSGADDSGYWMIGNTKTGNTFINAGNYNKSSGATASAELVLFPSGAFTLNGDNIYAVTASKTTSTYWYRKFSDGFIMQGGNNSSSGSATITLPLAFSNTNYTLAFANFAGTCYCKKKSTTQIYWHDVENSNTSGISWIAMGY